MLCYRLSVVIVLCCYLCCSVIIVLFYVLIVCTVTLPPGVSPIAVDKYIYIYIYKRRKLRYFANIKEFSDKTLTDFDETKGEPEVHSIQTRKSKDLVWLN